MKTSRKYVNTKQDEASLRTPRRPVSPHMREVTKYFEKMLARSSKVISICTQFSENFCETQSGCTQSFKPQLFKVISSNQGRLT